MIPGLVLLLLGAVLAVAAAAVMAGPATSAQAPRADGPEAEVRRAVRVLVLASCAVPAATAGAAVVTSGPLSTSGVAAFALSAAVVMTPLVVAARRSRHRRGSGNW